MDTYLGLSPERVALWWGMEWICRWLLFFPPGLGVTKNKTNIWQIWKELFDKYGPASGFPTANSSSKLVGKPDQATLLTWDCAIRSVSCVETCTNQLQCIQCGGWERKLWFYGSNPRLIHNHFRQSFCHLCHTRGDENPISHCVGTGGGRDIRGIAGARRVWNIGIIVLMSTKIFSFSMLSHLGILTRPVLWLSLLQNHNLYL